jgi:hypothetical protein
MAVITQQRPVDNAIERWLSQHSYRYEVDDRGAYRVPFASGERAIVVRLAGEAAGADGLVFEASGGPNVAGADVGPFLWSVNKWNGIVRTPRAQLRFADDGTATVLLDAWMPFDATVEPAVAERFLDAALSGAGRFWLLDT